MRLVFQRIVAVSIALWGVVLLLAHPVLYERAAASWWGWGALCIAGCYSLLSAQPIRGRLGLLHVVGPMVAIAFLSLWFSQQWANAAVLELLARVGLLWLSLVIARDPVARRILAQALIAGSAIVCAYAFLQSRGLDPFPSATPFDGRRIVATFENPNYLGNFAACAFPILLALFFSVGRARERSLVGMAAVLSYGACILAGSRGAWLAGLGGAVIVLAGLVLVVRCGEIRLRWPSIGMLVLALLSTTYVATRDPVIANAHGKVSAGERLFSALHLFSPHSKAKEGVPGDTSATSVQVSDIQVHDTTINHRYFIWQVAWEMARDRPVLGVGYGEFASQFPRYRDDLRDGAWYGSLIGAQQMEDTRYAHNELLHLWAECGLLGLLAFVWMIGCVGWILLDHLRRGASLYVWALVAGIGVMLIHSLVSYPLHLPFNGMIFWICAGLGLGYQREGSSTPS